VVILTAFDDEALLRACIAAGAAGILLKDMHALDIAPFAAPHDPAAIDSTQRLAEPSTVHPLGTDELGRDALSRLLFGARVSLLSAGRAYLQAAPLVALWPGLAIFITVLGFNLLGDGIRDATDPRLRRL
jgi:ABC-type dipeptide/oligopeptide/nickel transport system permease subunit